MNLKQETNIFAVGQLLEEHILIAFTVKYILPSCATERDMN